MMQFDIPSDYCLAETIYYTNNTDKIFCQKYINKINNVYSILIHYDVDTTNISSISYYKNNILHRENGPASISYYIDTNNIKEEIIAINGIYHIIIRYFNNLNNTIDYKKYYTQDTKYNPNGLILQQYYNSGNICFEKYGCIIQENDGDTEIYYKETGPAIINYYTDNNIKESIWYNKELGIHRENGPARIKYDINGKITKQCWYYNGQLHRENGPTVIYYNSINEIEFADWYFNGKKLTRSIIKNEYPHIYPYFITFYQKELPAEYAAYLKLRTDNIFV